MKRKRSDTQYCFKVNLKRPESEVRGVALSGHQTLADLHEAISDGSERSVRASFSLRPENGKVEEGTRLDDLKLRVGQTFEYIVESPGESRREVITVEFIDRE